MNQQRSRRFRTAQETKEKEEARRESVAIWECSYIVSEPKTYIDRPCSHRQGDHRRSAEQGVLGFKCYHAWHAVHGLAGVITTLLGRAKDEHRPWLEGGMCLHENSVLS